MFRVVDLGPDGKLAIRENIEDIALPDESTLRWIDLRGEEKGLERLRAEFSFHPLAIEDCRVFDQRPKLEEYRDHLFLVTQSFAVRSGKAPSVSPTSATAQLEHAGLELHELHAFLGKNYLVTVHSGDITALEQVWTRVSENPSLLERGVDFVYYLIASRLVEANFPLLDDITDELEEIEDRVLSTPARKDLARIFELKRRLVHMRKVLSPQRDTMVTLARRGDPRVSERSSHYFRDVHDQLVRLNESIEANRDLLSNALDAYLSAVSNRTNEIMKSLTLLSAVFLPLAFIVGFFGQNFDDLPGLPHWPEHDGLMYVMLAMCAATPIGMLVWFRSRRWS
ncbi:MAG TPA: magnesium/cobalt transporter CorA [Polyangiaceae bacterium]|nr:magnesium/cobalt transporter CorA [Polyangiaceae bacterium]